MPANQVNETSFSPDRCISHSYLENLQSILFPFQFVQQIKNACWWHSTFFSFRSGKTRIDLYTQQHHQNIHARFASIESEREKLTAQTLDSTLYNCYRHLFEKVSARKSVRLLAWLYVLHFNIYGNCVIIYLLTFSLRLYENSNNKFWVCNK